MFDDGGLLMGGCLVPVGYLLVLIVGRCSVLNNDEGLQMADGWVLAVVVGGWFRTGGVCTTCVEILGTWSTAGESG